MHRLDRDTSGCLLFARNHKSRAPFPAGVRGGLVSKSYLAVVDGETPGEEGVIDLPLAKRLVGERGLADGGRGRRQGGHAPAGAGSESIDGQSLVEFRPTTGRTHQIRIHAARGLGAAIVGDPVYGRADGDEPGTMVLPDSGLLLHAWRIVVPREPKEPIDVTAPLPEHSGAGWTCCR